MRTKQRWSIILAQADFHSEKKKKKKDIIIIFRVCVNRRDTELNRIFGLSNVVSMHLLPPPLFFSYDPKWEKGLGQSTTCRSLLVSFSFFPRESRTLFERSRSASGTGRRFFFSMRKFSYAKLKCKKNGFSNYLWFRYQFSNTAFMGNVIFFTQAKKKIF